MAYFSNGTEGMMYEERYCVRCENYRVSEHNPEVWTCPILEAHFTWNGEAQYREVLDFLIPMRPGGIFADKCSMFRADPSREMRAGG